jgi:hypothetical protein
MIDWHKMWRNPKPSELDICLPFRVGRSHDLPLAAYSVALGGVAPTSLVLTTIHYNDPLEVFRYQECEKLWKRYHPCITPLHVRDLRRRSLDPSDSSVTRRDLRRFGRSSDFSAVTASRLDVFVSGLLEMLQDPCSYNWEWIRDSILQLYIDTSMPQIAPGERDGVHAFTRNLLGFLACLFYVKWLIGLGSCESEPDFDRLNYPRIDPEWKRIEDWETDIKWSVRDLLRCGEQFASDPDLLKALQEFKSRTGFELRLIKRMPESCRFEIPELSLSFGDFFSKAGGDFTPQDSALQSTYQDTVGPVEDRILNKLMKKEQLSEASPIRLDPPAGSIHSLEQLLGQITGLDDPEALISYAREHGFSLTRGDFEEARAWLDSPKGRETLAHNMEKVWCDQYGPLGLRQDLQSKLIQRLGILENCAREMTTQPRRLQSAYYKLFFDLETKLKDFIRTVLEKELGMGWWELGISETLRIKCQKVLEEENRHCECSLHPFEYSFFPDLQHIMEKRWSENFQKFFEGEPGGTRDEKLAWLQRLIPIRNVLMHPRRPLSIRESWAIEVGHQRVEALAKKLGVFGESHASDQ